MRAKKASGKGKGTAKKSSKRRTQRTKKPADMVQVRENINSLVRLAARDIAREVIKVAKTGQLASARYLFEAVGLYPPTEETLKKPLEDSLAHTLLRRMGLPTEPLIFEEDAGPVVLMKEATREKGPFADEESVSERDAEPENGENQTAGNGIDRPKDTVE